jgi:hypothetical protein
VTTPDAPWVNTPQQVGPISSGPGTLSGMYRQLKSDPNMQAIASNVESQHPQDEMFRGPRVAAGRIGAGYAYRKSLAQGQGQPGAASDSGQQYDNGDGGSEMATAEDVQGLHDHLDQIHQTVNGMAGQQSAGLQQLTPQAPGGGSALPARPPAVDPLAASADARARAGQQQAQAQQQLANTRAGFSANFAARQARGSGVTSLGSGNGASASMNEGNMNGMITPSAVGMSSSGIGSSASSFAAKKWR